MYAKRRAVSVIISTVIIIFIISVTGSYLYAYSTEYFQKENNRYIRESELQKGQNQEQFKIANIWDHQYFLNITVYNYGKVDIHIGDVYFNGIRVNDFIFGRSDEILTNSLHKIGFFSPINLVTGGVYEVKIVSTRGMSSSSYWESNYTTLVFVEDEPTINTPKKIIEYVISEIKEMKASFILNGQTEPLDKADEADNHLWKSLDIKEPWKPNNTIVKLGANVEILSIDKGKVTLMVTGYGIPSTLSINWTNGEVLDIPFPGNWPGSDLDYDIKMWVDEEYQDIKVKTDHSSGSEFELILDNREASLGYSINLDGVNISKLTFTYDTLNDEPLWISSRILNSDKGEDVFNENKEAIKKILELIDKLPDNTYLEKCNNTIYFIINADYDLVSDAILRAELTPVQNEDNTDEVAKEISDAHMEMDMAFSKLLENKYEDCIDHYRLAWENAQKAIELANEV